MGQSPLLLAAEEEGEFKDEDDDDGRLLMCKQLLIRPGQREPHASVVQMARCPVTWHHLLQCRHIVAAAGHRIGTAGMEVAA